MAGLALFFVMRALGELLTYRRTEGGFAGYAREFLGPFWGYATTWTYWIIWVTTGMAELTAAASTSRSGGRASSSGRRRWSRCWSCSW